MNSRKSASKRVSSFLDAASEEIQEHQTKKDKNKSATYRLGKNRIDRINSLSDELRLQKGALVGYLLDYAIEAVENGDLDLSPSLMSKRESL